MKLLYYAPSSYGGLLIYSQEQADALGGLGVDVTVLCSAAYTKRLGDRYELLPKLVEPRANVPKNRLLKSARHLRILVKNYGILQREIVRGGYTNVFLVSFAEYFSPLWVAPFRRLAKRGVIFGTVVQEPVRDFQVGPRWWHRFSIGLAYSFLRYAFEHDDVKLDTVFLAPQLQTHIVPMGPHQFPDAMTRCEETRRKLGIPERAVLLFAFGHIRDNKNLDLAVRALHKIPEAHLLVAGKRSASSQKPESYYQEMAKRLGVNDRCTWLIDYVLDEEAANFFEASDLVLLTYSRSFRSASGVLNVAAKFRKPCIASSGAGSLQNVIKKYRLGVWVEPDDAGDLARGIQEWMQSPPQPNWEGYMEDNSWRRNAEIVASAMGLVHDSKLRL